MDSVKSNGGVASRPKRPLSAFNLFYRFKRTKVLDAIAVNRLRKDEICRLIEIPPGLEGPGDEPRDQDANAVLDLRRSNIRRELEGNLLPREGRDRSHRASQGALNGVMTFVELGAVVSSAWKECDDFAKKIFHELAEEGRELYRKRVEEYNRDGNNEAKIGSAKKPTNGASAKKAGSKGPAKKRAYSEDEESEASEQKETARIMLDMSSHANSPVSSVIPMGSVKLSANARGKAKAQGCNVEVSPLEDDENPGQTRRQLPPPPLSAHLNESEETLRLRVRELEGQLAQQRLQARIRELEVELDYRRANEQRLRSILLGQAPPPGPPGRANDGTGMPPPGRGDASNMGAPLSGSLRPAQHRMQEMERMMAQRMMQHNSEMSAMVNSRGGTMGGGMFPGMMSSLPNRRVPMMHPSMADPSHRSSPKECLEGTNDRNGKRQRLS